MKLIVGLGNPGEDHALNRHNIGFMLMDALHRDYTFPPWTTTDTEMISRGDIERDVLLIKPLTWMNDSGKSVKSVARHYNILLEDILVIHDDLDLKPGKLKVKTGGGHGGHNGLRSIDDHIGQNYQRLRMGVGHPGSREAVLEHVLSDFTQEEQDQWLNEILRFSSQNIADLLLNKQDHFMQKFALFIKNSSPEKRIVNQSRDIELTS